MPPRSSQLPWSDLYGRAKASLADSRQLQHQEDVGAGFHCVYLQYD
jgi:hypothetical protein